MPDELLNISGSDCTAKIFTFINFAILTGINKNHNLTVYVIYMSDMLDILIFQ